MPVFRTNIVFANGKRYRGYHINDDVELDAYYRRLYRVAQRIPASIISFDVVQVSEFSLEATYMRENNLKRMSPHVQNAQPKPRMNKRRRRF